MGDQKWRGCRVMTAFVNEMNLHAVDVSHEVFKRAEPSLETRKIVVTGPVV